MSTLLLMSFAIKKYIKHISLDHVKVEKLKSYKINNPAQRNALGDPDNGRVLRVRDIKVLEMEEEVGFDTKKYLPIDFIPVVGLGVLEQLDYEEERKFVKVFGDRNKNEILNIEDIVLYELEQTM